MRLISLESNIESFKPVHFNEKGISIILASKSNDDEKDSRKTVNGVGKSLLIYLIHFCLGASKSPELEKKIPGWEFYLKIKIKDEYYTIKRSTSSQDLIYFNNDEFKVKNFRDKMMELTFDPMPEKYLTFRNLISRFIRPSKDAYKSYNNFVIDEDRNPHSPLLNTLYLLGFNQEIIAKKFSLKTDLDKVSSLKTNLKKDKVLQEYFSDTAKDLNIDILKIKEQIEKKNESLTNHDFSKEYYQIENNAKVISKNIRKSNNDLILYKNSLEHLKQSLNTNFKSDSSLVNEIYSNVKEMFREEYLKSFDDVTSFHEKLLEGRKKKLTDEKKKITQKIKELEQELKQLHQEHNGYLGQLSKVAPFEQGLAIKDEIKKLELRLEKLNTFDNLIKTYDKKINEIEVNMKNQDAIADDYLEEIKDLRYNLNKTFSNFVDRFYNNRKSDLTIKNNKKENTLRFNLNVKIECDSSDGVNEVEIFCFDLLLLLSKSHPIKFLFHDNRLFSDVDPTQIMTAFEIVNDLLKESDFQYIVSLNYSQLDQIKAEFEKYDKKSVYDEIFTKREDFNPIVLELNDDSDEGKLLGIYEDIDYDKHK